MNDGEGKKKQKLR